jgi:hypothetical protein
MRHLRLARRRRADRRLRGKPALHPQLSSRSSAGRKLTPERRPASSPPGRLHAARADGETRTPDPCLTNPVPQGALPSWVERQNCLLSRDFYGSAAGQARPTTGRKDSDLLHRGCKNAAPRGRGRPPKDRPSSAMIAAIEIHEKATCRTRRGRAPAASRAPDHAAPRPATRACRPMPGFRVTVREPQKLTDALARRHRLAPM